MKRITLNEALKLWQMKTPLEGSHLPDDALNDFLNGSGEEVSFAHLSLCNWCRQRLWRLQKAVVASQGEADDYVIPLAASVGIPQEATWTTADEKYRIEFRRIVSEKAQTAVLILRVQSPFNLSGKTIFVRDANGRLLLRGQVSTDGKVAAIIDNIDGLVLKRLTISES